VVLLIFADSFVMVTCLEYVPSRKIPMTQEIMSDFVGYCEYLRTSTDYGLHGLAVVSVFFAPIFCECV
jgi:hypothetical protein